MHFYFFFQWLSILEEADNINSLVKPKFSEHPHYHFSKALDNCRDPGFGCQYFVIHDIRGEESDLIMSRWRVSVGGYLEKYDSNVSLKNQHICSVKLLDHEDEVVWNRMLVPMLI